MTPTGTDNQVKTIILPTCQLAVRLSAWHIITVSHIWATLSHLCCSPTSPRLMICAMSSCVGHCVVDTHPNTPHASLKPVSSVCTSLTLSAEAIFGFISRKPWNPSGNWPQVGEYWFLAFHCQSFYHRHHQKVRLIFPLWHHSLSFSGSASSC